jgi:hypothetical protein
MIWKYDGAIEIENSAAERDADASIAADPVGKIHASKFMRQTEFVRQTSRLALMIPRVSPLHFLSR